MKKLDLNSVFTRGSDKGFGVPYENALYVPARDGFNDGKKSQMHEAMYELALTHHPRGIFHAHYYYSYLKVEFYNDDNDNNKIR